MRRLLLALPLAAACHHATGPSVTRVDSAGIEIVTGPATDVVLDWPVQPTDTIYDPAVDTTLQGEARFVRLGADARGGLAFVDGSFGDPRVLRMAPGQGWHQVGRKGGGPGEYGIVTQLAVSPEGELLVGDISKRAYLRFGPDDSVRTPIPWSAFGQGYAQTANYAAGGIVALMSEQSDSAAIRSIRYLSATDTIEIVVTRGAAPKPLDYTKSCGVMFAGAPLFDPPTLWAGNAGAVVYSTTDRYEIHVWRGGKVVRILRRPIPPRAATEALAKQDLGEGFNMIIGTRPCTIPPADIIAQQGLSPTVPTIKHLMMAPDGTLWVERYTVKGEPTLRDVFDSTGAYLGTLTGNVPWPQAWTPNGGFIAVSANADSLPVIVQYGVGGAVRRE